MPLWFEDVWAKTLASWLTQCRDRQTAVLKKENIDHRSKISTSRRISLKLEEYLYENILECRKKENGKKENRESEILGGNDTNPV